ncbi:hypothetical protein A2160_04270 [Candidatus Beckwithbacteria bacterium RBG_13_42_9]|uniref:Uncharacterized protein n=1 Tax=Candidatus Beckwithbacteria bacterium RBG_13_42_9 TaxID=1797457 RepID=A0A1F5E6C9_9BACT|nr:MAG: hypothetical protein A2160_04270 [Candidatus Beckwithbacteria bacterium RBG_13_42_9]
MLKEHADHLTGRQVHSLSRAANLSGRERKWTAAWRLGPDICAISLVIPDQRGRHRKVTLLHTHSVNLKPQVIVINTPDLDFATIAQTLDRRKAILAQRYPDLYRHGLATVIGHETSFGSILGALSHNGHSLTFAGITIFPEYSPFAPSLGTLGERNQPHPWMKLSALI